MRTTIDELVAAKLVEEVPSDGSRLHFTAAGRELYERITAETGEIIRPDLRGHSRGGPGDDRPRTDTRHRAGERRTGPHVTAIVDHG